MMLTAVKQNDQLNPDALLGYLEFHLQIRKDDLAALWKKHNLPHGFLPREIRPCGCLQESDYGLSGRDTSQLERGPVQRPFTRKRS